MRIAALSPCGFAFASAADNGVGGYIEWAFAFNVYVVGVFCYRRTIFG
jgi:hypothetical protein